MKNLFVLIFALFALTIVSCNKKENGKPAAGKVQFTVNAKNNSALKAALAVNASNVLISIEDTVTGKLVYDSEKVELYNFDGSYISKPLSLNVGYYKLTKFMVLDSAGFVIYASPIKGSAKAYLVNKPLPISFSINEDAVTKLTPEVLSTAESIPTDFGYFDASFQVVKTFDFLVSVFVYDAASQNFQLTSASITISDSIKDLYTLPLNAKTNKITVNDGYVTYKLKVSKSGYADFIKTVSADSLKAYFNNPLVVVLTTSGIDITKGLVAYYPFENNLNDLSGNNKNGQDLGFGNYVNGKIGKARSFTNNGTSNFDYFKIPNTISTEYTLSFWISYNNIGTHASLFYISTGNDWVRADLWFWLSDQHLALVQNGKDTRTFDYSHDALVNNQLNPIYVNSLKLQKNTAYYVTATFQNDSFKIYLNGQKYATYPALTPVNSSSNNILIGVTPRIIAPPQYIYQMDGWMDELRIYNRALNQSEINTLYGLTK